MSYTREEQVEALLSRHTRAGLPFARLLHLYFDPFALFLDASRGPASVRQRARTYNRTMRWMLLPYLRRWGTIAASLALTLLQAEALALESSLLLVSAAGVICCTAMTMTFCTAVIYVLLGQRERV
jgi:hypothetical protein